MSINIASRNSENVVKKPTTEEVLGIYDIKQPRDSKGRFTSGELKLEKFSDNKVTPIRMEDIELAAEFVANFLKDNGLIRTEVNDGHIFHVMYLGAYDDSYYLFFRKRDKFGFHLNCGRLEEVMETKEVNNLLKSFIPLDWKVIQKA